MPHILTSNRNQQHHHQRRAFDSKHVHDNMKNEAFVESSSSMTSTKLEDNFEPTRLDVICGRGKVSHHHIGNHRFRDIIGINVKRYVKAKSKASKANVVSSIVDSIREEASAIGGAGFLKQEQAPGGGANAGGYNQHQHYYWVEIGDQVAREKVGHALRDSLKNTKGRKEKRNKSKVLPLEQVPFQKDKQAVLLRMQQNIFLSSLREDMGKDHHETTEYVLRYFRESTISSTTSTSNKSMEGRMDDAFPKTRKKSRCSTVASLPVQKMPFSFIDVQEVEVPQEPVLVRNVTLEDAAVLGAVSKGEDDTTFVTMTSPLQRNITLDGSMDEELTSASASDTLLLVEGTNLNLNCPFTPPNLSAGDDGFSLPGITPELLDSTTSKHIRRRVSVLEHQSSTAHHPLLSLEHGTNLTDITRELLDDDTLFERVIRCKKRKVSVWTNQWG